MDRVQEYEYAETLNQLTSLRAKTLSLMEAKAATDKDLAVTTAKMCRLTREVEAMARERGRSSVEGSTLPVARIAAAASVVTFAASCWLLWSALTPTAPVAEAYVPASVAVNAAIAETVEAALPTEPEKATTATSDVESQIRAIAEEKGFKWPDYLVRLAACESSLDPNAVNTVGNTPAGSRDVGLFQWNSHWQPQITEECALDIRCATIAAIDKINAGGQRIWVCDEKAKRR